MVTSDTKTTPKRRHGHGGDGHAGGHAKHPHRTPTRQRVPKRDRPIVRGQDGTQWKDIYQIVLSMSWLQFILALACVYLLLNVFFATLFSLDPDGIVGARHGSFIDRFFFSVQTVGSIGYGVLAPKSTYINVVVTFESFTAILYAAISTGLVFARVSRPFSRVIFSNVSVIVPFEGVPTLMFRAANQRANAILDATATVSLARQITTAEGVNMRRFQELKLVRARTPLFGLSWTVMHPIDESSPLYGVTEEICRADDLEIIVLLSGTDETFSTVIYARHSYKAEDILFGRRFVDVLTRTDSGRLEVDLYKFHDTEPWPHLESARASG